MSSFFITHTNAWEHFKISQKFPDLTIWCS